MGLPKEFAKVSKNEPQPEEQASLRKILSIILIAVFTVVNYPASASPFISTESNINTNMKAISFYL